jgi:hypothetical protein
VRRSALSALRAGVGRRDPAHPVHPGRAVARALDTLRRAGFTVVALTPAADAERWRTWPPAAGPVRPSSSARRPGLSGGAGRRRPPARIPLRAGADSLNVGHAAAIALYLRADSVPIRRPDQKRSGHPDAPTRCRPVPRWLLVSPAAPTRPLRTTAATTQQP